MPFPDSVTKSQFYYLDQFILSAAANKLYVHQVGLDEEEFWFRQSKTFPLPGCKQITTFTAANQFHSYLAICACSDRSVRVIDFNTQCVTCTVEDSHSRPIHKILQVQQGPSSSKPFTSDMYSNYNMFLTGALGDGVKIWDLRTLTAPVQRLDWPGSRGGRFQPGFDASSCLNFVAVGSEDGYIYTFDTRKIGYFDKLAASPIDSASTAKSPVTDVAFESLNNRLYAATLDGKLFTFG